MKKLSAVKKISTFLLLGAVAIRATAASAPHVSRTVLKAVELSLDEKLKTIWPENPFTLIGNTRGLYLDGYGALFTVEVSPILSTTMMMHPTVTKEEAVKAHKLRIERVAQLKVALKQAVVDAAASLDPVPADDQITLIVFLQYHSWEDVSGTPAQLTFQGKKRALLDAKRAGGAAIAQAVQVTEN